MRFGLCRHADCEHRADHVGGTPSGFTRLARDAGHDALDPSSRIALGAGGVDNPTIAETRRDDSKARGSEIKSVACHPTMYDGVQFADEGPTSTRFFISQTIVTATNYQLNRRHLNEALRAQLLQLEVRNTAVSDGRF